MANSVLGRGFLSFFEKISIFLKNHEKTMFLIVILSHFHSFFSAPKAAKIF